MLNVNIDFTVILQLIQFIIITFIIAKFVVTPIKRNIDNRSAKIKSLNEQAKESIKLMEIKKAQYEEHLAMINKEMAELRKKLTLNAAHQAQAIIDEANREIQNEMEKSRERIRETTKIAQQDAEKYVSEFAEDIFNTVAS